MNLCRANPPMQNLIFGTVSKTFMSLGHVFGSICLNTYTYYLMSLGVFVLVWYHALQQISCSQQINLKNVCEANIYLKC